MSMDLARTLEGQKEQMKLIREYNKQSEAQRMQEKKYQELIKNGMSEEEASAIIGNKSLLVCY